MNRSDDKHGPPLPPVDPAEVAQADRQALARAARAHYQRGNRFFDGRALERALQEWRQATVLWGLAARARKAGAARFVNLRAVLGLLLTVLLVYNLVFTLFPRDPVEMMVVTGNAMDARPWWERFLDTGRPRSGDSGRMGIREWWQRFSRRLSEGGKGDARRRELGLPTLDDHWADLLRRYGRWGPFFSFDLDYSVVAGYGLSRLGDYERAVEVFSQGIERATRPERLADLYQGLANTHYYQGYRLQPDGLARYDMTLVRKATEAYEKSVHYQPRPVSYGNLGWMYFLLGKYRQAENYSFKALELDDDLEYVRLNMGLIYLMEERTHDAYTAYREVIRRNPPKDVFRGGINDLKEITRDHPGRYPFAYLFTGMLAAREGDYTLARSALNRFIISPFVGSTWRELARKLLRDMNALEMR
jgi:tetratricopeptide (TPR) repeat protein